MDNLLSVVIPNRNSQFLTPTIKDLLAKAEGDIEVIINVDEKWPDELVDDPRVAYIHPSQPKGMRAGINACVAVAKGKYIMKTDDHCMFAQGFDRVLIENHLKDNWVQIPRRYSLDAENWKINEDRPYRDYHYLCYPAKGKQHDDGMHGVEWWERQRERSEAVGFDANRLPISVHPEFDIDDTPSMQGSCWFMTKNHFDNFLGGLSEQGYGQFAQESQEIGNKTWLGGGALRINKKTWYAHLHKGKQYGRMYSIPGFNDETVQSAAYSADYWMNNKWEGRKHDMAWLIDNKFPGMPTWPENWKETWYAS